jgi:cell wall-associated NlpC family hydrolase
MALYIKYVLILVILLPIDAINQSVLNQSINNLSALNQKEQKRQQILYEGEKYLGMRYRSRVGKNIFDCSGYVKFLMSSIGKKVTRSSVSQIHDGKRVKEIKDAKPGDILVFRGRNARNNRPGHVGLVHHWSNDTLYFIHSSVAKGITIDNMYEPYYAKRFLQVRNVIGD